MSPELNFHQLRIFYTVARRKSFSRAAESLDISQPTVSIQVRELEKALGMPLLHRRSKGLQLTQVGETVYDYAHRIFSLSSEMQETIHEVQELKTGHLTLGASTTPGEYILPVAIGRFRQQYPGVQVELRISNTRSIVNQILQRDLDLGMIGADLEGGGDDLEVSTYAMDEIVLVASPDHPLSQRKGVILAEVMQEGLVMREDGSATRQTRRRVHGLPWRGAQDSHRAGQQPGGEAGCRVGGGCGGDIPPWNRSGDTSGAPAGPGRGRLELHPTPHLGLPEGEAPLAGPAGLSPPSGQGAPPAIHRLDGPGLTHVQIVVGIPAKHPKGVRSDE